MSEWQPIWASSATIVICQSATVKDVFVRLKEEAIVPKKERRERDDRKRDTRGRRRREKPQTIQSHSIFEQGPADSLRKIGAQAFAQVSLISPEADMSLLWSCSAGWQGAPHVSDSSAVPEVKLLKKERKEPKEDPDEIICKLQRDDVTIYHPHLLKSSCSRMLGHSCRCSYHMALGTWH